MPAACSPATPRRRTSLVVTGDGKLLAIPFDPAKLGVHRAAVALLEGSASAADSGGPGLSPRARWSTPPAASAGRGGFLGHPRRSATPVDSAWDPQGTLDAHGPLARRKGARGGARAERGKSDIWVKALPAGHVLPDHLQRHQQHRPVWAPDGRVLLYVRARGSAWARIHAVTRADGTGTPQILIAADGLRPGGGVARRPWLLLRRVVGEAGNGTSSGVPAGRHDAHPLLTTPARESSPALSPDGRGWPMSPTNRERPRSTCGRSPTSARPSGRSRSAAASTGVGPERPASSLLDDSRALVAATSGRAHVHLQRQRVLFSAANYSFAGGYPT